MLHVDVLGFVEGFVLLELNRDVPGVTEEGLVLLDPERDVLDVVEGLVPSEPVDGDVVELPTGFDCPVI